MAITNPISKAASQFWCRRRTRQTREQLPFALQTLIISLSAGRGLVAGLEQIANTAPDPLASQFRAVCESYRAGDKLSKALSKWSDTLACEEAELLCTAIILGTERGGSVEPLLQRLESMLLERKKLTDKVLAVTSQGRTQAWVLCGLPWLLLIAMSCINTTYCAPLFETAGGRLVLGLASFLNVLGLLWINRLIKVPL